MTTLREYWQSGTAYGRCETVVSLLLLATLCILIFVSLAQLICGVAGVVPISVAGLGNADLKSVFALLLTTSIALKSPDRLWNC